MEARVGDEVKPRREAREDFGGEGGREGRAVVLPPSTLCFAFAGVATMSLSGRSILLKCLRPVQLSRSPSHNCRIHRTICYHARRTLARPRASPAVPQVEIRRTAKTQTTVKLKDLPQGVVKLEAYDDKMDDAPRYPTVVQGHRNNMQKFKNCVVLTRVGGFYEVHSTSGS